MNIFLLLPLAAVLQGLVPVIAPADNPLVSCTAEPGTTRGFQVGLVNRSSTPLVTRILLSVQLGAEGVAFWAPFDIAGKPLGPNSPTPVSIGPNQATHILIHLDGLRWARAISSVWPSDPFLAVVPAGRYSPTIRVEGEGGATGRWYAVGSCPAVVVPKAPRRDTLAGRNTGTRRRLVQS